MTERSIRDAVVLHLHALDREGIGTGDDPAPLARSLPGIWAGLGVREAAVDSRVAVLSALRDLAAEGLVERRAVPVEGSRGRHTVYALTDEGGREAGELRERLVDERVTVERGDRRERVELGGIDAVLEPLAGGAVRASAPADVWTETGAAEKSVDGAVVDPLAWAVANATGGAVRADPRRVGDRVAGRGPELGRLGAVVDAAAAGRTETVLITGGAGAGKSTLLERAAALARERGFAVGLATAAGDDGPYGPVLRALTAVAGPERVAAALDRHAGHPVEDPEERRSRRAAVAGALADTLREAADERPVFLGVDDLGDADPASLAVLGEFAGMHDAPVVLAGTLADDAAAEGGLGEFLAGLEDETRVPLDPFDGEAVAATVGRLLSDPDPPASLVEGVADRAGGNPLLTDATVRYLLEFGDLDAVQDHDPGPDEDAVTGRYPDPGEAVPDGIAGIVRRRIDELPEDAVSVLETAAVAGDDTPGPVLAVAVDRPETDLLEWVDLLTAVGLLVRRADGRLRFAGEAVRQSTLERVPEERQRSLHGRIADAAEAVATRAGDGATAAHHYERAGRPEAALDRSLAAAEWAGDVYAHGATAEHLEAATDLAREAGDDDALLAALEDLGDARASLGEYDEALRHYAYVRERGDAAARRRGYRKASHVHHETADFDAAVDLARRGLDVDPPAAGGDGDTPAAGGDPETVRLRIREGAALLERGDLAAAHEAFEHAVSAAGTVGDPTLRGRANNRLGTAALHLGDAEAAVEAFERSVAAYRESDRPAGRATPLVNLGIVRRQLGDGERALERLEAARAALAGAGDPAHLAEVRRELGRTHEARGDERTAAERYAGALAAAERADAHLTVAAVAADLGGVRQSLGEYGAAREHLERSLATAAELGDDATLADAHDALAGLAAQRGDTDDAREHAESALSAARDAGDPAAVARAMARLGERAREDGDPDRAAEYHREGLDAARGIGAGAIAALNLVGLARDAVEQGAFDRAADHAGTATDLFEGDPPPSLAVAVARVRADCDREAGDVEGARERLRAALDAAADRPPLRAQLLADLAELADERGEEDRAVELATEARDLAAEVGIEPVRERAAALLPDA